MTKYVLFDQFTLTNVFHLERVQDNVRFQY